VSRSRAVVGSRGDRGATYGFVNLIVNKIIDNLMVEMLRRPC